MTALSTLNHPNILKLLDYNSAEAVVTVDQKVCDLNYLVLEYAKNGEMLEYIAKTGSFAEKTARFYFKQLISAVEHIHNNGFAHGDIKPENVMLDSKYNLKLADFGFSTRKKVSYRMKGTLSYMSPELLAELPYCPKAGDLFACAVLLFIMVTQR